MVAMPYLVSIVLTQHFAVDDQRIEGVVGAPWILYYPYFLLVKEYFLVSKKIPEVTCYMLYLQFGVLAGG